MSLDRLTEQMPAFSPGSVWLAGAGPGDLGSLTIAVAAALGQADAVVYDALVEPAVLALAAHAEHHFAGKRGGKPSIPQDAITALLITLARQGKRVLRLKGGDPSVFGRGGEEAVDLARAGVPFRFLPGVTSAFGALAGAGIPATMRGINKAIILATGHAAGTPDDLDWAALARTGQPIVIYMGLRNLPLISAALMAGGLPRQIPAAVIMAATTPAERILVSTLGAIAAEADAAGFASPALVVVGGIVALRAELAALIAGTTP